MKTEKESDGVSKDHRIGQTYIVFLPPSSGHSHYQQLEMQKLSKHFYFPHTTSLSPTLSVLWLC